MPSDELKNPGALTDVRPQSEKDKDTKFHEVVASAAPVNWVEKPRNAWRKFPIQSQNGSGSCVAQTLRKMMSVYIWQKTGVFVLLSASHIYKQRANRPSPGMMGVDAFEIGKKGVTLEEFVPSENMTDAQMDSATVLSFMEEVGKVFKLGEPIIGPIKDIDTAASIIQTTGKAVMTWFYFTHAEWTNVPKVINPNLDQYAHSTLRHSVAAVDFTLIGQTNLPDRPDLWGKKALIIDESWGLGFAMDGQRVITEDFFLIRNHFVAHFMNFAFENPPTQKPVYTFNKNLKFGMTDSDVRALQNCLLWEGFFPSNVTGSSYFGSVTKKAVQDFQVKYAITTVGGSGYGEVGPLTRSRLNQLFS